MPVYIGQIRSEAAEPWVKVAEACQREIAPS
jgi:hypothetical protein